MQRRFRVWGDDCQALTLDCFTMSCWSCRPPTKPRVCNQFPQFEHTS